MAYKHTRESVVVELYLFHLVAVLPELLTFELGVVNSLYRKRWRFALLHFNSFQLITF